MYDLPVVKTVADAYRFTFSQWAAVLKYAAPLVALAVIAFFGVSDLIRRPENFSGFTFFAVIALWVAGVALAISFAVAMHRHCLIGPSDRGVLTTITWGSRQWRFLGWAIAIGIGASLLSIAVALPFILVVYTGTSLGGGGGFFALLTPGPNFWFAQLAWSAFSLVIWAIVLVIICSALLRFPLYAIDAPAETIDRISEWVAGNRLRIAGIFLLGDAIPFTAFDLFLSWVAIEGGALDMGTDPAIQAKADTIGVFITLAQLGSGLVWLAVTAVMLSMIYEKLRDNVPLDGKETV